MSFRYMRVMVLFDLPMTTSTDIRNYTKFRKSLIKMGFIMFQESIYTKLVLNQTSINALKYQIKNITPSYGFVTVLVLTEKQFNNMEIYGKKKAQAIIDSTERMTVL